jgi:Xaa-Pro aminopeptidase
MFPSSIYQRRRAALLRGLAARGIEDGLVVLVGSRESPINYADNCYPFRQDSSFLYFAGPRKPGLAASIDVASGKTTLYGDDPTMDDVVWTGPQPSVSELAALAGISSSRARRELAADAAGRALLYFPPYREDARAELAELAAKPAAAVAAGASRALVEAAIELREIKSEEEAAELDEAVEATIGMHRAALAQARPGMTERDVMAIAARAALAEGAGTSFTMIATTRGAVLHNHSYGRRLEEGDLFLLDAGAESQKGYAGDLTTTFPVSRRFDSRQRELYELVLRMGAAAVPRLEPGRSFRDAHFAAARELAVGLGELGLMRGDPDEAVASGAYALFFPHGLGHMLGLDVHDMESYGEDPVGYAGARRSPLFGLKSLRLAKPLKAGMAFTVEPGAYFIPELHAEWSAEGRFAGMIDYEAARGWLGIGGVRNEEDWIATEGGARRLGPLFDKSADAIGEARR